MGLGPGAHSFDGNLRIWNTVDVNEYLNCLDRRDLPVAGQECLSRAEKRLEQLGLGLRTREGVPVRWFQQKQRVQDLIDQGLAEIRQSRLTLSVPGMLLADEIAVHLAS